MTINCYEYVLFLLVIFGASRRQYDISFACVIITLLARSDCKINDISADFITAMKCREMQGKRVNTIDNEIFENLP